MRHLRTLSLSGMLLVFSVLSGTSAFAALPKHFEGTDVASHKVNPGQASLKLEDAKKATVLVFLSAKCPCSNAHEAALQKLRDEFADQGFQFLGIHSNQDETLEMAQAHFQKSKISFPVLHDSDAVIANAFSALKTPHAFVLSPSGEVLFSGGMDDSKDPARAKRHFLREALTAVSQGKKPEVKEARTLGCVIKRERE